jgi:Leucine-rich repeat (LRR) protein
MLVFLLVESLQAFNIIFLLLKLSSVSSYTISCKYSDTQYYDQLRHILLYPTSYQCYGSVSYECEESRNFIEGVSRNHLEGRKDSDVIFLEIAVGSKIDRVPKNIDHFYPRLEIFKCSFCMVSQISSDDLKQMPNLNCIYLGHNQLKYVPSDLFKHNPNMKFIGLEGNPIQSIGPGLFENLPELWIMYFNNPCLQKQWNDYGNIRDYKAELYKHCVKTRRISDELHSATIKPDEKLSGTNKLRRSWEECEAKYNNAGPDHS